MVKTRQSFQIDRPSVADLTTISDDYSLVPFTSERGGLTRNYWDTWHLAGVKILKFWAADNNLKVKVMGSIDGTDFTDTVEAEFDVTTTTPVTKRILTYWPYLQVQVKPATSAQHGTLSVLAVGTTITAESGTELSATIDPAGLATQTTLAAILAKIIAAPSTEANQGLILTALGLIATEATAGDIKTATEALAALISAGALAVSLGELPDTAAGDLADINTASTSIDGKLPALVGGKIPVDASVSIDPAGLATEATAGDIKTAVEALAGATPDTAAGDLADINAASASIDGKLPALVGGKIPVDASVSIDPAGLATEATLGTMQADIAHMKADLAAILAILES